MYSRNGHLRILLIEDNRNDEDLIRIALEKRAGYKAIIKRIETESEMLLAVESETFDVILCDYLLPHFDARKALKMVRERLFDIPFIFVSGYPDEPTALEMLKLGAHDFIYKDQLSRLAPAIRRELMKAGERMVYRLDLESNYALTVEAWGRALELRDITTKNHTVRATDLTLRLARAFGVDSAQFKDIYYGSLLHDVGKMGIPDSILLKEAPLEPSEMKIIKMHPGLAYEMLAPIPFFKRALNIPYCHHEKFDGTGYPRGLAEDEIPFEARLFSIVDVYDALTNDRPYRKSWGKEKTIEYIREEKGKSFEAQVVNKFIEVIR